VSGKLTRCWCRSLLSRLILISIETGGLTSALFIVTLALFVHPGLDGSSMLPQRGALVFTLNDLLLVAVAFEFFVGRAYSNTLMYNLGQVVAVLRRF
jgi:hypothetical protein